MPKIALNPIDNTPAPTGGAMFVRVATMAVMTISMLGTIWMLLTFAGTGEKQSWQWEPDRIRTNFHPLLTTAQIEERFRKLREEWMTKSGHVDLPKGAEQAPPANKATKPEIPDPFGGGPDSGGEPGPVTPELPPGARLQSVERRLNEERELELATQLKRELVFRLIDETTSLLDFVPFDDVARDRAMNEFTAYRGRQAQTYELLAAQIMRKLPAGGAAGYEAFRARLESGHYYWGVGQPAVDTYRGRAFEAEGRLFDLYAVKPDPALVMQDGTRVEVYYEGVVALLAPGVGRGEHPIEHRVVLFQTLTLPESLRPFLNESGKVAHDDKLASEAVMVKLSGAYLRRWVYSREVAPFSTEAKRVYTQAHLPLLLTADLARSERSAYELSNELLMQVRDEPRGDPEYLETEGAYYAMLAKANAPDDAFEPVPEIGYFDLAGAETGPKYRSQGIRVVGMIGDEYVPVILPPNISGLRRVFRTLVVHDTSDVTSPKRYLVDMIEPPTGLEPRAIIDFRARYYRNVYEADSTSSAVRPLLIVRRVSGITEGTSDDALIWAAIGGGGAFLLLSVLTWLILSERRERAKFESTMMEQSRERLKKRGGLKLKPLPGDKPAVAPDADPPAKPAEPPTA